MLTIKIIMNAMFLYKVLKILQHIPILMCHLSSAQRTSVAGSSM